MRKFLLRLATFAGVVIAVAACSDNPTLTDQSAPDLAPGTPVLDAAVEGCVTDGLCILEPIVVDPGCDPWESLDWCQGGSCITSVFQPTDPIVLSCPGTGGGDPGSGGTRPPPDGDPGTVCPTAATGTCPTEPEGPECEDCNPPEEESTICPQPFVGNVLPTLINVAGRNHEFQFTGTISHPLRRLTGGASPATYQIGLPETSKDAWWIAESGTIQVMCRGAWITRRLWVGQLYVVGSDLHMVMGPGHPDF